MDQTKEQEQVLIARNNETGQVGAVTGMNDDGTPKLTDVKSAKLSDLVRFSKGQNPLEAFMSNFVRQCKNPSTFGFFKVPADRYDSVGVAMSDLIKDPQANADMLKDNKVELPVQEQSQTAEVKTHPEETPAQGGYQAINADSIDWEAFKTNWGVEREQLEKSGDLERMLNYGKSGLVKVHPTLAGEKMELDARLSLRKEQDGNIKLVPHFIRLEPNLEKEYRGHQFTAADKEQLLKTGNLGRIVELEGRNGEKTPSFVSLDRLTNEIVSMPVNRLHIKENIGKTTLTADEIKTLKEGLPVVDKEITLRDGKTFKTTLQVNADARCVEFVPKAWQNHKQGQPQQQAQSRGNSWTDADGNIRPISKWKGIQFTDRQKQDYVDGKTVVLQNATDSKGQPCTLYVKFNPEKQRPFATTDNPDLKQTVAPSNDSATQVAVNNDGSSRQRFHSEAEKEHNEATKNVAEPLQKYQTAPKNEAQQRQQRKPKGPKP